MGERVVGVGMVAEDWAVGELVEVAKEVADEEGAVTAGAEQVAGEREVVEAEVAGRAAVELVVEE